jgi:hypothetical protein
LQPSRNDDYKQKGKHHEGNKKIECIGNGGRFDDIGFLCGEKAGYTPYPIRFPDDPAADHQGAGCQPASAADFRSALASDQHTHAHGLH